jgi:outer membrane protein assembly factor BamB
MESIPMVTGLTPPLRLAWQSNTSLKVAVAGNGRLYGITTAGSLVAMNGATGELVWAGR